MHVYFRQYAQQMGMQNVRNILPEQIDVLINTKISDVVNKTIKENVNVTGDRVVADNSKISHINALKPLYIVDDLQISRIENNEVVFNSEDFTINEQLGTVSFEANPEYLFLVGFSLNYINTNNNEITRYFPVRLIDDSRLAETLNDFVLRNRATKPIITIYNDTQHVMYLERFINNSNVSNISSSLRGGLFPFSLRMSYIAKPAVVKFDTEHDYDDAEYESIDCNLPDFLHVDIVKGAVELYRNAINGGSSTYTPQENAPQQNEQNY